MKRNSLRILLGSVVVVTALAGCQSTQGSAGGSAKPEAGAAAGQKRITRPGKNDVEAPDVFSANEKGLWDGRPSLGGVWVASPEATDPERVAITNTENGKTIQGALFRRERENPGPRLQLSSDAAGALGILAGQPVVLKVVALRREEIVVQEGSPAPEATAAEEAPAATNEKTPAAEDPAKAAKPVTDAAAIGAAAVAAVGKPEATDGAAAAPAATEGAGATVAEPAKKKKGLFGGLFGGGKKQPKNAETAAGTPAKEGAPLSAIDPIKSTQTPAKAASVATTPLKSEAGASQTAATTGSVRIVIGAFSVEANAKAAAARLQAAGLSPTITATEKGEKTIYTVTAAGSGAGADLLAKVKSLGYADAYVSK